MCVLRGKIKLEGRMMPLLSIAMKCCSLPLARGISLQVLYGAEKVSDLVTLEAIPLPSPSGPPQRCC